MLQIFFQIKPFLFFPNLRSYVSYVVEDQTRNENAWSTV